MTRSIFCRDTAFTASSLVLAEMTWWSCSPSNMSSASRMSLLSSTTKILVIHSRFCLVGPNNVICRARGLTGASTAGAAVAVAVVVVVWVDDAAGLGRARSFLRFPPFHFGFGLPAFVDGGSAAAFVWGVLCDAASSYAFILASTTSSYVYSDCCEIRYKAPVQSVRGSMRRVLYKHNQNSAAISQSTNLDLKICVGCLELCETGLQFNPFFVRELNWRWRWWLFRLFTF